MKNEQQQQAKNLYFQTNLNKTQIAELLDVSRSTLHTWIMEGSWDRLKKSAEHLPAMLAENCYHLIGHLTDSLLSEHRDHMPVQKHEAETLYRMVVTTNKLKNRDTLNDSMEMFGFFLEGLKKRNEQLAKDILPYIDAFLTSRASIYPTHVAPDKLNEQGYAPLREKDRNEQELDRQDFENWRNNSNAPVADDTPLAA